MRMHEMRIMNGREVGGQSWELSQKYVPALSAKSQAKYLDCPSFTLIKLVTLDLLPILLK